MEGPPSSKRVTAIRRDGDRGSIRDGIGLDGKGGCQQVFGGEHKHRSVGACMFFVQGPHLYLSLIIARLL